MADRLATLWTTHCPGLHLTLLADNLAVHRDVKVLAALLKARINVFFLPPNTSHFLQPLDDLVFAIYKSQLVQLARELSEALIRNDIKWNAAQVLTAVTIQAEQKALQPDKIVASFANVHLLPFDAEKIMEMARNNISEPAAIPSAEWEWVKDGKVNEDALMTAAKTAMAKERLADRAVISRVLQSTRTVTVTAQYGVLYDSNSIVKNYKEAEAKAAEAAKAKTEKAEAVALKKRQREEDILARTCRVNGCENRWCKSKLKGWMFCGHCDVYATCGEHWAEGASGEGQRGMAEHEVACPKRPKKRRRGGEEAD